MNQMQTQCAWCKRWRWLDGTWRVEEEEGKRGRGEKGLVTHGVCPDCKGAMVATLAREEAA